jgi:hypothetical protein
LGWAANIASRPRIWSRGARAFLLATQCLRTRLETALGSIYFLTHFTNATSTTLVLVFGSEDVRVKEAGETLKLRLGVKSGGKAHGGVGNG